MKTSDMSMLLFFAAFVIKKSKIFLTGYDRFEYARQALQPVSYTHLTLPTKLEV